MARCFVTRDLPGSALDRLRAAHDVDLWPERLPPPAGVLRERAARADGLLCLLTDAIDADLIAACPDLKAISNLAVGVNNVDLTAATARGIPVGYTPDVLTESTADLAFALMLAVARRLPEGIEAVRDGSWITWEPAFLLGRDVGGATLGIVGMGRIGHAVQQRAEGFGMTVIQSSRSGGMPLGDLLERADFVSIHCPLTPGTRDLIGAEELRRMKPTAYLINTARGRHRQPAGPDHRAARGLDRRRRARRHRPRAVADRRPAARRAEPDRPPPRRFRHARHARADGRPRGRQPPRRAGRRSDAPPVPAARGLSPAAVSAPARTARARTRAAGRRHRRARPTAARSRRPRRSAWRCRAGAAPGGTEAAR